VSLFLRVARVRYARPRRNEKTPSFAPFQSAMRRFASSPRSEMERAGAHQHRWHCFHFFLDYFIDFVSIGRFEIEKAKNPNCNVSKPKEVYE
jgi:hypothetical protein